MKRTAILRDSERHIFVPAASPYDDFFDSRGIDLPDRDQPAPQDRAPF